MSTVISIDLDKIPLATLILRAQTLGSQVDLLNEERAYLRRKIDERLTAGESEHAVHAEAPGAEIEASTQT